MSETEPPAPAAPTHDPAPPRAQMRRSRGFSFVWLIPLIAAAIAGYLAYQTLLQRGPLLTLSFDNADGLETGQTQVKFKNVALGTVESVDLSQDNSHVVIQVRMNEAGKRLLTDRARFWVVRPRFTSGDISGLDTLVSGAYIAIDPGAAGGRYTTNFTGLEAPPGVRSDEPGQTYLLKARNIGSLNTGSPVFYRDVQVGEVLGYDIGDGLGPVNVSIFVRAPFDKLVRGESHFWNSSGVTASLTGGGFHLEIQSLQAVFSGGVTFDLPPQAMNSPPSPNNATFPLYESEAEAQSAGYQTKIPLVSYFASSVSGLEKGAPLDMLGIQIGEVTDVRLLIDPLKGTAKVRVAMEIQPERVFAKDDFAKGLGPQAVLQQLVNQGLRTQIDTASYVTGQKIVSLVIAHNAPPVKLTEEDGALVLPSQSGGLDSTLASVAVISAKLEKVPFDKIGDNLNKLLITTNNTIGGQQMQQAIKSLSATLQSAKATLQTINQQYGGDSEFQYNLGQLLTQANAALRSIRQLTDYLDRHPEALLRGRSGQ
jgi:paraquat-inducible protein B